MTNHQKRRKRWEEMQVAAAVLKEEVQRYKTGVEHRRCGLHHYGHLYVARNIHEYLTGEEHGTSGCICYVEGVLTRALATPRPKKSGA